MEFCEEAANLITQGAFFFLPCDAVFQEVLIDVGVVFEVVIQIVERVWLLFSFYHSFTASPFLLIVLLCKNT